MQFKDGNFMLERREIKVTLNLQDLKNLKKGQYKKKTRDPSI